MDTCKYRQCVLVTKGHLYMQTVCSSHLQTLVYQDSVLQSPIDTSLYRQCVIFTLDTCLYRQCVIFTLDTCLFRQSVIVSYRHLSIQTVSPIVTYGHLSIQIVCPSNLWTPRRTPVYINKVCYSFIDTFLHKQCTLLTYGHLSISIDTSVYEQCALVTNRHSIQTMYSIHLQTPVYINSVFQSSKDTCLDRHCVADTFINFLVTCCYRYIDSVFYMQSPTLAIAICYRQCFVVTYRHLSLQTNRFKQLSWH